MSTPSAISLTRTALRLRLHIKPSASAPRIVSLTPQLITLAVAQPPRDGEANRGVVEFMCQVLGYRKSDAEIVKGLRGRQKVLEEEEEEGAERGRGEVESVCEG